MAIDQQEHLPWGKDLDGFLKENPGMEAVIDPERLEYYRQDLNVDLPPLLRDMLLRSIPDLVLRPTKEEHIREIFSFARKHKIPLTVRGAGTWGYGGAVPTSGGILIDLGLMDTIEVNPAAMEVTVGPGARFLDIENRLEEYGLNLLTLASGKGGSLIGWMATGGMGIGTFHSGPVGNQVRSLRVITPAGETLDLAAGDRELRFFLSTEGQMGIIAKATLRVGKKPSREFPFVVSFEKTSKAYVFAKGLALHPTLRPEDLVVYHREFARALRAESNGKFKVADGDLVLIAFSKEEEALRFQAYLHQEGIAAADEESANLLWEKRFLPMSIKPLGPSLLASEVILPIDQVAPFHEKVSDWGKRLGLALYPIVHLVSNEEVLFLAMIATDSRKKIFYADLMLVPMMLRLAIQQFKGKPYGLGIWNTPFLGDLHPKKEIKELARYKKKVDPAGILNPGKFFNASGRLGRLQKLLFQPGVFDIGMAATQWLLFKLVSAIPVEKLRASVPVVPEDLGEITDKVLACAQCGSCVARCPVYRATGDETLTARGKLLTIKKALAKKQLELSKVLPLYFCIRCGRCDDECQVHMEHRSLFEKVETYLAGSAQFPMDEVKQFISEVETSPDFQKFLDVVRTGFNQKIEEQRNTFPLYHVTIDKDHCINCATCVDACMYSVRKRDESDPRRVVVANEAFCRGCGACLERCPQVAQGKPATTVELHPDYLKLDDPYWNFNVVTNIDLEATTGKIPVSGTGQGDPHRGFGNDGIRFGHFHIVGPAQNLLYESTEDAIAVGLGRKPKYLVFEGETLRTAPSRLVHLRTPILIDVLPMDGGEELLRPLLDAAEKVGTRVTLRLSDIDRYQSVIESRMGVVILRLTAADTVELLKGKALPKALRASFPDLVEIEIEDGILPRAGEIRPLFPESTLLSAVIKIGRDDIDSELRPVSLLREKLESLISSPFDILCLTSEYDHEKKCYLTTEAVPAVHRFLVDRKIRHRFSVVAAGGIRSAADTQKTVQRGANGIKIDWPVLLTVDPQARQKFLRGDGISVNHDPSALAKRIANLIRVWNIQITEVLGASGFKDIKKTVGEENRLVIFDDLEERIYDLLHSAARIERNRERNVARMEREFDLAGFGWRYSQLRDMMKTADSPHRFCDINLQPSCYRIFDRDYVWPASLISSVARMAAGDKKALLLRHTEERGKLGDGFDAISVRFKEEPDEISDGRLDAVSTAVRLSPALQNKTPFMGAGMSVGSIGPGTWRARVLAARTLGTQLDTGEGGYPTIYILDSNWYPLDFTDEQVAFISRFMKERKLVPVEDLMKRLSEEAEESSEYAEVLEILKRHPASMPVQYVPVVTPDDQPYVSTQLKTGLFGVTKETIRRARRVVIAYSQGAKQGVGGHLLGRKVFGLVSRLRGVPEGVSLISPFPFHNCYSIEDVKAFIDAVRMINRRTAIAIKVSPSPDIEFIVSGLARIAKDNQMMIEVWLDGPRGGTGAAPDIIKGQMGMHMEYAIPICHEKLIDDGLRDQVVFMGSGGFRTWGDVVKGIAMGLDGVVLGTADLVAIGCVRDRNCESGCRSGISTINPQMQLLRDVDLNTRQLINFRAALQAQVARAIAGLGLKDIRELRGRYDCIEWPCLDERVENRRSRREQIEPAIPLSVPTGARNVIGVEDSSSPVPSDCGVAAIVSNHPVPSHVMDLILDRMANRGMDGVGIWKGGCYSHRMDHYVLHILVKGILQDEVEERHLAADLNLYPSMIQPKARREVLEHRRQVMKEIVERYFTGLDVTDFEGDLEKCRVSYRRDDQGQEKDFRSYGERDPGDVFRFFVRVRRDELGRFIENDLLHDTIWPSRQIRYAHLTKENYRENLSFLQEAEDEYIYRLARRITDENYVEGGKKRVAVLSCGKNSGCWKTDGREIPWETPAAPVNVIHRRLATGSVVDQMNSHPFAELHTALTHNGETTNYRTMLNRIKQFNLTPLAQTDTAVASLKLHLLSQYLQYPFDALVESFSPTTGWKLTQLSPEKKERYQRVQEAELESAPDGPYQYLCGRIDPYRRVIERLDIIDPSLLRPNVAMLYDDGANFVSIICSEKQGADAGMQELYRLGLIRSTVPGLTFTVGTGMLNRVFYDETGKIIGHEVLDKEGRPIKIPCGALPESLQGASTATSEKAEMEPNPLSFFRDRLPNWSFGEFKKALEELTERFPVNKTIVELTGIYDTLPGLETGEKDRGALSHMLLDHIETVLSRVGTSSRPDQAMVRMALDTTAKLVHPADSEKILVVDAKGFRPEGINPLDVLSCFLDRAHQMGWRKFIVYKAAGQRGIGMGIGAGPTPDTVIDVFGSPGEYCGAFNMGARVRVHNHAQNFTGMVMHSGVLEIHGDVGKVTGYSAKGGEFNILGNVVDRGWVCAVSDPRSQGLVVNVVGTAFEHLCQALMGGSILMLGLYRTNDGLLRRLPSPYSGAKILAGASAGEVIFFDPDRRVEEGQYQGCAERPIDGEKWQEITNRLLHLERLFGLGVSENGHITLKIDGAVRELAAESFRLIRPRGELAGYH